MSVKFEALVKSALELFFQDIKYNAKVLIGGLGCENEIDGDACDADKERTWLRSL